MRVTWCTDVHLNFVRYPKAFGEELLETRPDAVLLTGDIAECPSLERCLDSLAQGLGKVVPVWFVLGNHDAYYGSVVTAKANARRVSRLGIGPLYLGMADQDAIDLGNDTWLVGVDGWYDARSGNPFGSRVEMSDFDLVSELKIAGFAEERRPGQIAACRRLAMVESDLAKAKLKAVMRNHPKRVVFATHVSPFVESTFHEGQISNSDWLPWFSNSMLGLVLEEVALARPEVMFEVYCGHTHSPGVFRKLPNLVVTVGAARYGFPSVAQLLEF